MKKIFLIIALLLNLFLYGSAQTTLEEYTYVTKLYKEQLITGVKMMPGYSLEDVDEIIETERSATLKKLVRTDGTQKKTVAYMLIYRQKTRSDNYFCVPHPDSGTDIKDMFAQAIQKKYSLYNMSLIILLLSRNLAWN